MVYLDYAANTPVNKEVLDLYYRVSLEYYGNANSIHKMGRDASELIKKCTQNIAHNLKVSEEEIIYTSGATEANNLVVKGICKRYKNYGKHVIVSPLSHNSIMASLVDMADEGIEVDILSLTKEGTIDLEDLKEKIRPDTILVSLSAVDSEIGIIEPISKIANIIKEYPHTYLHIDATQAIGKINLDYSNVDLITIAPHKFYGVNGIGLLVKKKNVNLKPLINGGRSTTVFRSGTPNLPSIVATDKALELSLKNIDERYNYVLSLNKKIVNYLSKYKNIHLNSTSKSIPYIINFSVKGVNALNIVSYLDEKGIYVSSKTSCCPVDGPSKLVYALTKDKTLASSSIRVSLSHLTSNGDIDFFLENLTLCLKEVTK